MSGGPGSTWMFYRADLFGTRTFAHHSTDPTGHSTPYATATAQPVLLPALRLDVGWLVVLLEADLSALG